MIVFVVLAVVLVVGIGLVAVGRVTGRSAELDATSIYDIDEAVVFVAERLSDDATASLSYDDVRSLLRAHLDYLEDRGVARRQGEDELQAGPLVASEDDALAFVLGRVSDQGIDAEDTWVVEVLDANEDYLEAIGAIGAVVDDDA